MIDLPQITSLLSLIVGPQLRLETAYSFIRHKGCPQFEMHGGHRGGRVNFRYSVVRQQPNPQPNSAGAESGVWYRRWGMRSSRG
eukprot:COSAG04_NODE_2181_length_4607_cov_19.522099_1_plen_84_part_00